MSSPFIAAEMVNCISSVFMKQIANPPAFLEYLSCFVSFNPHVLGDQLNGQLGNQDCLHITGVSTR
ncbi:hypothetical protein ColKHC_01279 [Colletotrichum higginsianum]|nr:hypothetical protein ColKHC_01279 [Colletotrichum higginsianum]